MITICKATTSHLNDLILLFDVYRIFYEKKIRPKRSKKIFKTTLNQKTKCCFYSL